jgi:hypothetical protein
LVPWGYVQVAAEWVRMSAQKDEKAPESRGILAVTITYSLFAYLWSSPDSKRSAMVSKRSKKDWISGTDPKLKSTFI